MQLPLTPTWSGSTGWGENQPRGEAATGSAWPNTQDTAVGDIQLPVGGITQEPHSPSHPEQVEEGGVQGTEPLGRAAATCRTEWVAPSGGHPLPRPHRSDPKEVQLIHSEACPQMPTEPGSPGGSPAQLPAQTSEVCLVVKQSCSRPVWS